MIDVADNLVSGNDMQPLSTVMDLQDYFRMAKDALNKRMTDVKSTGDDKIVPKRRVLPD
jgi:hypothetical protein